MKVYQNYKKKNNNDQEIARNIQLNLDQKASLQDYRKSNFAYLKRDGT